MQNFPADNNSVLIARALISNPSVLVLDEPTNGIDAKHVSEFYETLEKLKDEGITIILVTHDIGVVAYNNKSSMLK